MAENALQSPAADDQAEQKAPKETHRKKYPDKAALQVVYGTAVGQGLPVMGQNC